MTSSQYTKGEYFFDIHPPLGKYGLLLVSWLVGYDADVCDYTNIADVYDERCKFLPLRLTAASFGVATVPLVWLITRMLGGGRWAGMMAGVMYALDGLNTIESRLILTDSQLVFWILACALVGLLYIQRRRAHYAATVLGRLQIAARRMAADKSDGAPALHAHDWLAKLAAEAGLQVADAGGEGGLLPQEPPSYGTTKARTEEQHRMDGHLLAELDAQQHNPRGLWITVPGAESRGTPGSVIGPVQPRLMSQQTNILWLIGVGLACGAAVSVKWTGLAAPGMLALECWFALFFLPQAAHLPDMLVMLGSAFVFYVLNYAVHFALLPNTGDGDAFMSVEFQRTRINSTSYDPAAPAVPFWTIFWQLAKTMLTGNAGIDVRHHWESVWTQWLVNARGVLYYSKDHPDGTTDLVYLLGHPIVVWGVGIVLVAAAVWAGLAARYKHTPLGASIFGSPRDLGIVMTWCYIWYAANLLPYMGVARSCFAYHYIPALLVAEMFSAVLVERWAGVHARSVAAYVCAVVIAVFIYFAPWVYALPLTANGHAQRRWMSGWD